MSTVTPTAFRMTLLPGVAAEYRRGHDAIWPELVELLHQAGISNYSIHLDEADGVSLLAVLTRESAARYAELADEAVMQQWWEHMRDLMETDETGQPVTALLTPMFYLP